MQIRHLATAALIIMLITAGGGCLLLRHTTFTLLSTTVTDADGFPVLKFSFNLSDYATVSIIDPAGTELHNQSFIQGTQTSQIPLAAYRHCPSPGVYTLKAIDAQRNKISSTSLRYIAPTVNISDVTQEWFRRSSQSILSLTFTLHNTGLLPFYPDSVNVSTGTSLSAGPVMPTVVLPGQTTQAAALIIVQTQLMAPSNMTIRVLDTDGKMACSLVQNISATQYPTLDYSWYYRSHYTLTLPNASSLYLVRPVPPSGSIRGLRAIRLQQPG